LKINLLSLIKFKIEIRFLLVGAWNTLFGYAIFFIFLNLFKNFFGLERSAYVLGITFSHIFGIVNSFFFHKFITFRSKEKGKEAFKEFLKFFNSYLLTFLINLVLIFFLVELILLDPVYAGAISIPICVVVTFFLLSNYSFKKNNN